jgi:hypothetical protein
MNRRLTFRPDLADCVLEDRVVAAIPNLGVIVLTTSGFVLLTPFPGANSSGSGSLGSGGNGGASTASSVSGAPTPTYMYITGANGLSSLRPGNITGVPSLAAGAAFASATTPTIQVGSGADTAGGPTNNISAGGATNNTVGLFSVADPTQRPLMTTIGGNSISTNSPVLPPGQSYRDNAPVAPPSPYGVLNQPPTVPNPTMNNQGTNPYAPNPQNGAPRLGPFGTMRGLNAPLPGSVLPSGTLNPSNN